MIDPLPHLEWSRRIALAVARRFGFGPGSQEEADIVQTAYLELCRIAGRFEPLRVPAGGDVSHAFRCSQAEHVRGRCVREAWRLRNGGVYKTCRHPADVPFVYQGIPSCAVF